MNKLLEILRGVKNLISLVAVSIGIGFISFKLLISSEKVKTEYSIIFSFVAFLIFMVLGIFVISHISNKKSKKIKTVGSKNKILQTSTDSEISNDGDENIIIQK